MNKVGLTLLLVGFAGTVAAQSKSWPQDRETLDLGTPTVYQAGMSLGQAVAMVQARYGAKSVRASTIEMNGRIVHEIRLRSADGSRVWTVHVDAASGQEI
jgi:uncharacterized membrane protein YkoI